MKSFTCKSVGAISHCTFYNAKWLQLNKVLVPWTQNVLKPCANHPLLDPRSKSRPVQQFPRFCERVEIGTKKWKTRWRKDLLQGEFELLMKFSSIFNYFLVTYGHEERRTSTTNEFQPKRGYCEANESFEVNFVGNDCSTSTSTCGQSMMNFCCSGTDLNSGPTLKPCLQTTDIQNQRGSGTETLPSVKLREVSYSHVF